MNVLIDTDVVFTLNGDGRKVVLDALELDEFVQSMWAKAPLVAQKGADGAAVMKDGQPVEEKEIQWAEIDLQFGDWLRAKCNGVTPALKKSEVRGIWANAGGVWAKKNARWREPEPESASPTSPPSTDPRYQD